MCFGIFSFWIRIYSENFSDQDILWQICMSASDFFCDLSCSRPYRVSIFISLLLPGSTWTAMGWAKIDTCHYSLSSCGVNMMHCWRGLSGKRSRSFCWTKSLQENMLLMHLRLILILPHSRDCFRDEHSLRVSFLCSFNPLGVKQILHQGRYNFCKDRCRHSKNAGITNEILCKFTPKYHCINITDFIVTFFANVWMNFYLTISSLRSFTDVLPCVQKKIWFAKLWQWHLHDLYPMSRGNMAARGSWTWPESWMPREWTIQYSSKWPVTPLPLWKRWCK